MSDELLAAAKMGAFVAVAVGLLVTELSISVQWRCRRCGHTTEGPPIASLLLHAVHVCAGGGGEA